MGRLDHHRELREHLHGVRGVAADGALSSEFARVAASGGELQEDVGVHGDRAHRIRWCDVAYLPPALRDGNGDRTHDMARDLDDDGPSLRRGGALADDDGHRADEPVDRVLCCRA